MQKIYALFLSLSFVVLYGATKTVEHTIENGETVYSIAQKYHTTTAEVRKENNLLKGDVLKLGRVLKVPTNTYFNGNLGYGIESGDTLLSLAGKFGTTVAEIKALNHIDEKTILRLGQIVKIPQNKKSTKTALTQNSVTKTVENVKTTSNKNIAKHTISSGDTLLALSQKYQTTVKEIKTLNNLEKNQILKLGQLLLIPKNTYIRSTNTTTPLTTSKVTVKKEIKLLPVVLTKGKSVRRNSNQFVQYAIQNGDTLFTIARKHHTTIDEVKEANKLKKGEILALGRILNVPQNTYYSNLANYTIKQGDNLFKIARKHHTTIVEVREVNKMAQGEQLKLGRVLKVPQNTYNPNAPKAQTLTIATKVPQKSLPKTETYTISKGDTLFTIARKHKMTISELREANNMKTGERLKIGRVLTLKSSTFNARNNRLAKQKRAKRVIAINKKPRTRYKKIVNTRVAETNAKRVKLNKAQKRKKYELGDIFYSHLNKKQKSNKTNKKSTKIISLAKTKLGRRYVWGATGGSNTFDCSGLTTYVYKQNGIKLPRRAIAQSRVGKRVSRKNLKKGDLIFFDTSRRSRGSVNHVGIYIGDNKFIHASSAKKKVVITSLSKPFYSQRFRGGRRM